MILFFSFLVAVGISIALIPILIKYADSLNMLDQPGERKVHAVAIPRCGGIGLSVAALVAALLFIPVNLELLSLLIGSVIIIFFGVLDDLFEINYKWKFVGQFIAVFSVMYGGIYLSYLPFTGIEPSIAYIAFPITVIFAVGVTNAVNLSDGLDGLAAGIMFMTLAVICYLAIEVNGISVAVIALAVAGGIVGFLWFNTHPAIVFMGDTGSQFIGFMAVFLSVYLTQTVNQALNPALPLLILGLPILDTLTVMYRRIRAGKSPFSPDKTHIHHRLMQHGFSHTEAVATIYILQGIFLASALFLKYESDLVVIGGYLLISATIILFFYWAKSADWHLHKVENGRNRRGYDIWRDKRLFVFCRHYINFSIGFFLVSQLYCLLDRMNNISIETYCVMLFVFFVFCFLPQNIQNIWVRFSVYIAAIFANVMANDFPEMLIHTHWLIDLFLLILACVVSAAIRVTRKAKFRMTTQDMLVMLIVIASIILFETKLIDYVTFRLFCLVYALEYLLHRDIYKFYVTRYTAALSGVLLLAVVLPTISL